MAEGVALVVTWKDLAGLHQFQKQIADLNSQFPKVLPRILNQVGDRAKTKVVRALTKQTGLKGAVVRRAVENNSRAFSGKLAYDMRSRGGNIRLKYLSPKETEAGVVAKPFGKSTLYPGAFLKGGAFPNRKVVSKFDGHAFYRLNSSGSRITFARSGVFIPKEMVIGITKEAFEAEVKAELPIRVDKVIRQLLGGGS